MTADHPPTALDEKPALGLDSGAPSEADFGTTKTGFPSFDDAADRRLLRKIDLKVGVTRAMAERRVRNEQSG